MTIPRPFTAALSANDQFKLKYPRYLRGATLIALALTALFAWLMPRHEPQPYQLRQAEIVLISLPDEPVIVDPPQVATSPKSPPIVEAVPEKEAEFETIPESDFWREVESEPYRVPDETPFVPTSAKPQMISFAKADYPEIARRASLEGTVLLQVLVGRQGRAEKVVVVQGVHPLLDRAAEQAARKCRFEPARQGAITVKAWLAIPYRFRLH